MGDLPGFQGHVTWCPVLWRRFEATVGRAIHDDTRSPKIKCWEIIPKTIPSRCKGWSVGVFWKRFFWQAHSMLFSIANCVFLFHVFFFLIGFVATFLQGKMFWSSRSLIQCSNCVRIVICGNMVWIHSFVSFFTEFGFDQPSLRTSKRATYCESGGNLLKLLNYCMRLWILVCNSLISYDNWCYIYVYVYVCKLSQLSFVCVVRCLLVFCLNPSYNGKHVGYRNCTAGSCFSQRTPWTDSCNHPPFLKHLIFWDVDIFFVARFWPWIFFWSFLPVISVISGNI